MTNSHILGIETSTTVGSIALADREGRLVFHQGFRSKNGFSRKLLAMIDDALSTAEIGKSDLAAIAVTQGPGSFTGVRVGLVTAKTIAHTLSIPLYLESTLKAVALRCNPGQLRTAVIIDARRSEFYTGVFEQGGEEVREVRPEKVESLDSLLDALAALDEAPILLTGEAALGHRDEIAKRLGKRAHFAPQHLVVPSADILAVLGAERLTKKMDGADPLKATPNYIRASDAERAAAKKQATAFSP